MRRLPIAVFLVCTALPSQPPPPVTLPSAFSWVSNNFPVGSPPIRYQQWFHPAEWINNVGHAMRVTGLDFFAGPAIGGTNPGSLIDIEVTMANGPITGPQVNMDANMTNPFAQWPLAPVVVVPRSTHSLGADTPVGSIPLSLTFTNHFTWDGESAVVVDFKMWNNGKGNGTVPYNLQYTQLGGGLVWRLWGQNLDPSIVQTATAIHQGQGIAMQFHLLEGVTISYGTGCPGAGGFIPLASTTGGLPVAPNPVWTHVVTKANSQKPAIFTLGWDKSFIFGIPLPYDLAQVGAPGGCFLLHNSFLSVTTSTVGGGPGAGTASVLVQIPPVTTFTGQSLMTQWLIIDDGAPNGWLCVSQAQESIIG